MSETQVSLVVAGSCDEQLHVLAAAGGAPRARIGTGSYVAASPALELARPMPLM